MSFFKKKTKKKLISLRGGGVPFFLKKITSTKAQLTEDQKKLTIATFMRLLTPLKETLTEMIYVYFRERQTCVHIFLLLYKYNPVCTMAQFYI